MGIDLLIKIFILFFIKIVNLLLHYAMEDRPVKENITDKSIKKKEDISQVSNQMKSQTISMKTFLNFSDKKLTVIPLSCWLFSEPLISTSLWQNSPHEMVKIQKNWKMCDIILSHTKMAAIDSKSRHISTISQKNGDCEQPIRNLLG